MLVLATAWFVLNSAAAAPATTPAAETPSRATSPNVGGFDRSPPKLNVGELRGLGIALAAGGGALATGASVLSVLAETQTTPDLKTDSASQNETLVQGGGLFATAMVAVGAAMILTGVALVLQDAFGAPATPTPAQ